jgi:RND family efflux transporter MFP subunit
LVLWLAGWLLALAAAHAQPASTAASPAGVAPQPRITATDEVPPPSAPGATTAAPAADKSADKADRNAPLPALADLLALPKPGAEQRQEIRAQLIPRRYTTIASEIGARIRKLPVAEAGAFMAGEPLVEFDCSVQQAQRRKALAELEASQATHRANEQLAQLNSIGQLELDLSRAGVSRSLAEVGMHDALLDKCTIPAPFPGRVAEQKVREQQFVQPGQMLLDILDDRSLELEFLVPSSWLRWLKPGQPLRVAIDETRRTYPARFTRIGARVDPVSQTVKVAASIDGQHSDLIAGMSGRILAAPPR